MSNKCEILRNGKTLAGPMLFDAGRVRDLIMRQGGDYRLVPNALTSVIEVGTMKIMPVSETLPELAFHQTYGKPTRTETAEGIIYSYPVEDRPTDEVRQKLLDLLNATHDAYDKTRFEYQGVLLAKDIEARVNSVGVLKEFELGVRTSCEWRGHAASEGGAKRITVSSTTEMQQLAGAIGQASAIGFDAKTSVEDMINSATDDDLPGVDVEAEFQAALTQA